MGGSHSTCIKEGDGYEGGPAATLLCPRLLTTQQGPAQDTRSQGNSRLFGNWRHKTNNFRRPGPATGECDGSWVGLGDATGLMALGPANSSTAFSRAGKELDIQIHFSEQLIDPFFTTHSPAPSSLAMDWSHVCRAVRNQLEYCSPAHCRVQGTPRPEDAAHGWSATASVCCSSLSCAARPGSALPGSAHRWEGIGALGLLWVNTPL